MAKRCIAVFDLDGTLTTKDTLLEFIKFACGVPRFYWGFLLFCPILILMKLHLFPNWKAKQLFFSHFFKGWEYNDFKAKGQLFANEIEKMENRKMLEKLNDHLNHSDVVYVISASIFEWVQPWCEKIGVSRVLATQIEVDANGIISGRFATKNCYGKEKVRRLLEVEPERRSYILYAYGDSRGDKEMIAFSDYGSEV
ncbi:MAG: haloacid dehalogenase-like hydrolase [Prevotella sp.]|nr:haloacid dehalogenase-like hydrolase [Prevotella sp.]